MVFETPSMDQAFCSQDLPGRNELFSCHLHVEQDVRVEVSRKREQYLKDQNPVLLPRKWGVPPGWG